ncbi:glycosyl transferase [Methanosarcina sp. 2.H.T.1A.6]|uniref:S-layer glycoprotein N-glycosyltransferase AglJ n=1 Tax=unclassified Methanosarcina TaxID=2644672 RepID=UPI0006221829|nr:MULTISPECIES: S-layer glycoprotein N-glycosyltransferase AglJ [unclassified Methanosarcina]KKG18072.1 glycosyl transferase [Methanosarcina sp. 2.H.T.1A.3]KKG20021.1 glycosyl transferase [Methanosarcina sp. 2.H.T.1A.6]KKG22685.1 glycosyl transferase [Methanosarcina sp. 2.H.T.1A.8]KKG25733.1 glycosyl transferase [Methanosarcina sp. 2.H.T.1A.15]
MNNADVCILIPTLNEVATIGELIKDFKKEGFSNILVIDGNSRDGTAQIAEAEGARVVLQTRKGKGQAVIQAFEIIESPYVVMVDGDGTYLAREAPTLLEPVLEGKVDHVIGSRLENYSPGAFTKLNLVGNRLINMFFNLAYGVHLTDILSGYRAFTLESVRDLELNKAGFEIETEISVECILKKQRVEEVPITYLPRSEKGATKLNPVKDGIRIGSTIYRLAKVHNPMFYFGVIGFFFIMAGLFTGTFVVFQWLQGITRIPLSILTTLFIIFGLQMFIFGMISDLIVTLHRQTVSLIQENNKQRK